jgi:hypothetical protein
MRVMGTLKMLEVTSRIIHENVDKIAVQVKDCKTVIDVCYTVDEVDPITGQKTGRRKEVTSRYRFAGNLVKVSCNSPDLKCEEAAGFYEVKVGRKNVIIIVKVELAGDECKSKVFLNLCSNALSYRK